MPLFGAAFLRLPSVEIDAGRRGVSGKEICPTKKNGPADSTRPGHFSADC
jgi:hypothetical protein